MRGMIFECPKCNWEGDESNFSVSILDILYKITPEQFRSFVELRCPECDSIVTVMAETFNCMGEKDYEKDDE
jgi:hypothetical protein